MNKIFNAVVVVAILVAFPVGAQAVKARPSTKRYVGPTAVPAVIEKVTYVTGIPEIDVRKYTDYAQANGWMDFKDKEAIFYKIRIDQKKRKGTESVELFKIPYSTIKELYFGYDAVYKAANDTLPTALNTIYDRGGWPVFAARSVPLHMYMKKRNRSAVIVYYEQNKKLMSVVLMANDEVAKSIYLLLAKQAGLKVKEPRTVDDVKE